MNKKKVLILISAIIISTTTLFMIPQISNHKKAEDLLLEGNVNGSKKVLIDNIDYSPSKKLYQQMTSKVVQSSWKGTIGLRYDGTVIATGTDDYGQLEVANWTDIISISASERHTIGLKRNGTVVGTGSNSSKQLDVTDWTDIMAITSNSKHSLGLKSDGTVVGTGSISPKLKDWKNIVAISASDTHVVGLKEDGTVISINTEIIGIENYGQSDINNWIDIVDISAGFGHTVGLKSDGSVVAAGEYVALKEYNLKDIVSWTDIIAISSGYGATLGLKKDGSVVVQGHPSLSSEIETWTDIIAISASEELIGLKKDGTLVISGLDASKELGLNPWKRLDVENWTNIGLNKTFTKENQKKQDKVSTNKKDTSLPIDTTSLDTLDYYISILNKSKTMLDIEEAIAYLSNKGINVVPLLDDESSGYLEFLTIHDSSDVQKAITNINGKRLNPGDYEVDGNVTDMFSILPGETVSDKYDIDEIVIAIYDTQDGYNTLRVSVSYRPF